MTRRKTSKPTDRAIGFNVSMPISDFLTLEKAAQAEAISRSELVRRALQFYYEMVEEDKQTNN